MTAMNADPPETSSVLLVEDNRIDQRVLEKLLAQHERFQATHVFDIEGGIEKLEARSFDCVLLDWHLPDGDGSRLLDHITQHYPWLPVLVITGDEEIYRRAFSAGAQNLILKDRFDANALEGSIINAIEQKKNANLLL